MTAVVTGTRWKNRGADGTKLPYVGDKIVFIPVHMDETVDIVDTARQVVCFTDSTGSFRKELAAGVWKVCFTDCRGFEFGVTDGNSYDLFTLRGYIAPPGVSVSTLLVPTGAALGDLLAWGPDGLTWADGVSAETIAAAVEAYLIAHPVEGVTEAELAAALADLPIPDSPADVGADPAGTATSAISAHVATADPHPQYLTGTEGDARYDALGATAAEAVARLAADGALDARLDAVEARPVPDVTAADLAAHSADTTGVHGIPDTTVLVVTTDPRLVDARTPTAHGHTLDAVTDTGTRVAMTPAERTKLAGVATGATVNASDAALRDRSTHTGTQPSASLTDLTEAVQDIVAALIVAGSGVTVSYDDAAGTFTVGAAAGTVTDPEIVRDVIGAAIVAGAGVQVTVSDAGDTITVASTAVLPTRQVIAGAGLTGGGDLSADRTLTVTYGTAAGTAAQGNDSRIVNAVPSTRTVAGKPLSADVVLAASDVGAAPALGADDNYVTDAEKAKLAALSGINTGDQVLPTWSTLTGKPAVIGAGADAAAARAAIGAGTSSLAIGTTAGTAKAGDYSPDLTPFVPKSIVDAKGDLLVGTGLDTLTRLGVGPDGQTLVTDSTQAAGVKWAAVAGGGGLTRGTLGDRRLWYAHLNGGYASPIPLEWSVLAQPLYVMRPMKVYSMAVYVETPGNAGEYVAMGIYTSNGGAISALYQNFGTGMIDVSGDCICSIPPIVISPGFYWKVVSASGPENSPVRVRGHRAPDLFGPTTALIHGTVRAQGTHIGGLGGYKRDARWPSGTLVATNPLGLENYSYDESSLVIFVEATEAG
ncbi:MAG: hypothetical protein ACOYD1_07935 [Candidatus Nanopelagicales bacterium]